jgi:hypothetical protein
VFFPRADRSTFFREPAFYRSRNRIPQISLKPSIQFPNRSSSPSAIGNDASVSIHDASAFRCPLHRVHL